MSPIEAALEFIESLGSEESFSYRKVAHQYGVNRTTLARRHQASQVSRATKSANQQKLSVEQELSLVQYIKRLSERHLPPTREMIQNFASQIAKEPVSESWVTQFINQYQVYLISC
jgi:hypothetical protein